MAAVPHMGMLPSSGLKLDLKAVLAPSAVCVRLDTGPACVASERGGDECPARCALPEEGPTVPSWERAEHLAARVFPCDVYGSEVESE